MIRFLTAFLPSIAFLRSPASVPVHVSCWSLGEKGGWTGRPSERGRAHDDRTSSMKVEEDSNAERTTVRTIQRRPAA